MVSLRIKSGSGDRVRDVAARVAGSRVSRATTSVKNLAAKGGKLHVRGELLGVSGKKALTSLPKESSSRTTVEEMSAYCGSVKRSTVSTSERRVIDTGEIALIFEVFDRTDAAQHEARADP